MAKALPKLSNSLIGAAGVHFVAFQLSLRGLVVLPTIRNAAGIDLLVYDPKTGAQASLQVKTALKRPNFWPTPHHERCLRRDGIYYVFLRRRRGGDSFEAFLESGDRVAAQVRANAEAYARRGNQEFPHWRLPDSEAEQERLREAWYAWGPTHAQQVDRDSSTPESPNPALPRPAPGSTPSAAAQRGR